MPAGIDESKGIITVEEFRRLLGDETSTDEQITQRIAYLGGFCRAIIKQQLKDNEKAKDS